MGADTVKADDTTASAYGARFWDGCDGGELLVQQCGHCDRRIFPPEPACPGCLSQELEWTPSSLTGTVYSFSIVYRSPGPAYPVPYALAVIDMDGGWSLISNIIARRRSRTALRGGAIRRPRARGVHRQARGPGPDAGLPPHPDRSMLMTNAVGVTRLGHVNIVVSDHNAAVEHWRRLFDAEFFLFMYVPEQTTVNNLAVIGDTCVELFAPWDAESVLGRTLTRRGPGMFAVEFTVRDYDQAETAITDRGLRVTHADRGAYFWVHPADLGGIAMEFCPALFAGDPRESAWLVDGPVGEGAARHHRPAVDLAERHRAGRGRRGPSRRTVRRRKEATPAMSATGNSSRCGSPAIPSGCSRPPRTVPPAVASRRSTSLSPTSRMSSAGPGPSACRSSPWPRDGWPCPSS